MSEHGYLLRMPGTTLSIPPQGVDCNLYLSDSPELAHKKPANPAPHAVECPFTFGGIGADLARYNTPKPPQAKMRKRSGCPEPALAEILRGRHGARWGLGGAPAPVDEDHNWQDNPPRIKRRGQALVGARKPGCRQIAHTAVTAPAGAACLPSLARTKRCLIGQEGGRRIVIACGDTVTECRNIVLLVPSR
jgi:hypothetical protein